MIRKPADSGWAPQPARLRTTRSRITSARVSPCTRPLRDGRRPKENTMPNLRHHFQALLSKINPPADRVTLVSGRVEKVRDWLREHEFSTKTPHTQLSGSYSRHTAIEMIPDVDVLLFIPDDQLERTPNAVLLEVNSVLQ